MLPTTAGLADERAERNVPPRPVEGADGAPLPRLDGPTLPRRLASEPPGWVREVDVVVVGSGVAGLTAALECREQMGPDSRVMVVTKDVVAAGSTRWAQGGIASVQAEGDTVAEHVTDTLVAGAGLCEPTAVDVLVREGPAEVATLVERGTQFDLDAAGQLALTREGGHHRNRIAHAGGDATGAEIERALVASVTGDPGIEIVEQALVLDLLPAVTDDGAPAVAGVTLHVLGEGTRQGVGAVRARAVVLATGGIGQIYAVTTNPPVSTGDGVAAALRAGARLRDVEFIQFHPTVLFLGTGARGQLPLVSEAVRGEGGLLVNSAGERFMVGQHELAELAPRDVVAKGIMKEMGREGTDHVYVDGRMLGEETWRVRFPTILHSCRVAGIDPVTDLIPVAPAAHYFCGGVETDLDGATTLAGLYACGEVASSGVHGANRLASNSLLEGLVFAARIAGSLARDLPPLREPLTNDREAWLVDPAVVPALQRTMSRDCGGLRDAAGLERATAGLTRLAGRRTRESGLAAWEATNLLCVATAVLSSARLREESRGAHWRDDFGERREVWQRHLVVQTEDDGLVHRRTPVGVEEGSAV